MIYDNIIWTINDKGYYKHNRYGYLHRYIYEEFYKVIPKGMIIHHRDENKTNNDINNLQLMTRAEHIKLHHTGKKISEAHKQWLSEFKKGVKHSKEFNYKKSIPVIQLSLEGFFIAEFYGSREAERQTGINNSNINKACRGKAKQAGGFNWIYANDYKKKVA